MKIGLIGLGIMGKPMAKNLLKAGYELMANNRSEAPIRELAACGATPATQPEIGEQGDVVLTMLPNSPRVKQAIRGGLAGSTVMNAKAPMMIAGDNKPGFKINLHIKDLNNALDCAHAMGAPVPMTAEVQEVLQWLHNQGEGQHDHSRIAHYHEKLTGIQIGR